MLLPWVKNGTDIFSASPEETTSKVSPWSRVSWPKVVFVFSSAKVTPVIDQERPEKENENPFVVALLTDNSLSSHVPLSRRETVRSPDLPTTPSHADLDPREHLKSGKFWFVGVKFICYAVYIPCVTFAHYSNSFFRKLFNLSKEDNVCQYVIKRPLPVKEGKKQKYKAPKVQRLVTPIMLQRKRHRLALKRRRAEKNRQATAEYAKILAQRQKEAKEAKELRRKRSASHRESRASKSSISQWSV